MKYNYIAIEGGIGAGKTSLATRMAEKNDARLILEQFDDNPYLEKFYSEPTKFAFHLELSFLLDRQQQLATLLNQDVFKKFSVADYHLLKSLVFAKITLNEDDFLLYRRIFNMFYSSMPTPDLMVYLYQEPDRLLHNISNRGRDYERNISKEYLVNLQKSYFEYFKEHPHQKTVIIDVTKRDFVKNSSDYEEIEYIIFNTKFNEGINRILLE